ncbi:unnamed protein product [Ilex paraguariensis]|uniref:RRM domain-containing protein n=1 Tax=Ilex paraguariensis TaxID=185542 RepID=A0ABC8V000_9AQUA
MDPIAEDQLDHGDEEFGGAQKIQYHGGGAIPALAEDEMIGEEDEFDDLYNDVNVGEGFRQLDRSEAQVLSVGAGTSGVQSQKTIIPEPRAETMVSQELAFTGTATEGRNTNTGLQFPEQRRGWTASGGSQLGAVDVLQKGRTPEITCGAQPGNLGFQGPMSTPQRIGVGRGDVPGKVMNESAQLLYSGTGGPSSVPEMPANQMGTNVNGHMNRLVVNENQIQPAVENGATMLLVGELHWWTTDSELESVLSQYGRVKEIKFYDERASGKSKGYCQVEFYEPAAAAACKDGMNGHIFNGRACVVVFASPQTMRQMGASYMNKTQVQPQSQQQGRRPMNDGAGRGGGTNYPSGDAGRNFGRGGWGRGQGILNRGPGGGPIRGRGGAMGSKNIFGNGPGVGSGASAGAYGQGLVGPGFGGHPAGLMPHQGMLGAGFDPSYMARGTGYGGFPGPTFPGMLSSFPAVNPMGLTGVAPHVNPAFFGRGMGASGMGMMGNTGMDGQHSGMWTGTSMGGWGGEEHGRRMRESSYGGEDGASEYGYGEASYDKGVRSNGASREKEQSSEHDRSGNSEKRHRDEKEQDRDNYDREHRYREEKDSYRERRHEKRDLGYEDDWDRGQSSSRSRAMPEEDHRLRSRDGDYGKRRRLPSE